ALTWSTDSSQPGRFMAVHGRRAATFGYSQNGLESWAYPVQILTSFSVSFRQPGTSAAIAGQTVLRRVIYSPEGVTRIYAGPDFIVRENIFVPLEEPGTIVTYEVNGTHPVDIVVHFTPVLDLMWPASVGGQEFSWNAAASGYVLSEATHRYTAIVSSPDIVAHDEIRNTNKPSAGVEFTIRAGADRKAQVVIAGGIAGQDAVTLAKKLLTDSASLEKAAVGHYDEVLDRALQIQTPDPATNRALLWSVIAVDQAWVCNPDLGCGQVGGYGPSRRARRPQYDWFFAGDGLVSTHALVASGQYDAAREELEFILRYQDRKSGMIWHELSQSAATLNWNQYPYMFVHVGLTADFLAAVASYHTASGDLGFVRRHWEALQLAYRYCQSLLAKQGGLPRIPDNKQGANEQDALSDELSLSAGWVAASEAFAQLAAATGHHAAEKAARSAGQRARQAIGQRYWDERQRFWISGHTRSGAPALMRESRPASTVLQSLFSAQQRAAGLDQLAGHAFQTDWGTRGKSSESARYDPNSYASGSVWAIGSAEVAAAFWAEHRPLTALPVWSALVPWSSLDSPGHMHETLAGDYYHEEIESVPEQTWSSAAFFTTTVQGLLGLRVDGVSRHLTFAPHLPADWNAVNVRHLHVGGAEVALSLTQSVSGIQLQVRNGGTPIRLEFAPQLPFGAQLRAVQAGTQPLAAQLEQNQQDTHARMEFTVPEGNTTLTLSFSGGVTIVSPAPQPEIGEPSRGIKITGVNLRDRVLTLELDQLAAGSSFELRTPWTIRSATGAEYATSGPSEYHFTMKATRAPTHNTVTVNFAEGAGP
ncbi:MAG: hypothetical protein QOI59_6090, partial [Gammaproteobacteria bacterium]|nr:hypothetical protein [Gammaproteobacteria bacterium]